VARSHAWLGGRSCGRPSFASPVPCFSWFAPPRICVARTGAATVAKAIATFERTVVSGPAPFDRWLAGGGTLAESAERGLRLFTGKANCVKCHSGWRFTDDSFHDIGVVTDDLGRGRVLEGIDAIRFAFKTPTLRDVDRRAPYMHNGSEQTLEDVIDLYDRGGRERRPSRSSRPSRPSPSRRTCWPSTPP
jgi:cytochrome c peroxidase